MVSLSDSHGLVAILADWHLFEPSMRNRLSDGISRLRSIHALIVAGISFCPFEPLLPIDAALHDLRLFNPLAPIALVIHRLLRLLFTPF